jgi:malate dehydrogenase (oxaloacetate-decarboxylating)(NADP+)
VGATTINEEMKLACVRAIAELARADVSDVVAAAYGRQDIRFGPDYLIPPPFDPRLITTVAPAVAEAAMASGVATRPIADLKAYRAHLQRYVYTSGTVMQPVFAAAAEAATKRIVYAEGEDDRVLRAVQVAVDERLARPVLVGRPEVIRDKMRDLGLRLEAGRDYEVAGFDDAAMIDRAAEAYYLLGRRRGLERDYAAAEMRRNGTLIGAMLVRDGRADGMLCGTSGPYAAHLKYVAEVIGLREGVNDFAAMHLLMLPERGTRATSLPRARPWRLPRRPSTPRFIDSRSVRTGSASGCKTGSARCLDVAAGRNQPQGLSLSRQSRYDSPVGMPEGAGWLTCRGRCRSSRRGSRMTPPAPAGC